MLNLRIRPVNDDGSTDESTRVIATQQITYTGVFNSVSTISFDVSRDDWQPTAYPFVVRVEYSTGGRYVPLPEHDLFIIERDSDDSKDAGRIVTYRGIAYVPWILTGTYVGVGPWNVDGERTIDNGPANAGRILDYFFTESTSRGPWLKHLDWNFNGTRDSANVLWKTEDREEFAWRVDQHWYGEMLTQLADQSLCEWTVMGTELQLFRPGTRGVDRSETIQLGGPRFDRVPVETDTQGQFTHVISTYDEGRTWTQNEAAEERFGRRSVAASHTGVKTAAGSKRLAQKLLSEGQEVKREEAYEWTPTSGDVSPFRDFSLGDLVSAVSRGAKNSRRVIGVIITQSADEVTVQARVGERISTLAAKNQKALEAVTGGSIPGGTGGVFPTVPPVEKSVPAAPVGLYVVSNTGEFASVGARATVVLAWSPVTETVTGEEVVITEYALYQDGVEVLRTHNTSVSVEMPSAVSRDFQVVAFAGADRRSDPSATVSVTGALPVAFELDPTVPVLSSSHGNVRAVWDGLYTTAAPAGAHTIRVEARVQGTGPWIMQGAALTSGGEQLVSVGAIGDTVEVRFTAFDQLQRLTGTSSTASIEVQGVGLSDLDEAVNDYLSDIETIAIEAQQSASGDGNKIHYGITTPVGTEHKVGDTWFDGANDNKIHTWDGENWTAAQFGTDAISDTAINAAKLAANAVTEGKILNGAITNDKLDSAVQNAITTAQSTASNAESVANSAQSDASAAQAAASNAQDDADQAISDAAAAAGIAGGKADVLIQNTAPPADMRKTTTLWIDTTGGANTPKRWVSGTTWTAVTDKAATDAAAAAATAQSAAGDAQSRADDAHTIASGAASAASAAASAASAAQTAANNAQTTANGKNKVVRSTANASSPGNYVAGDQWWKYSGSQITAMWIHSGSAWVSQTLTDSVITNLNAGSITAGTISADRLSATNIKSVLINAGAIETANIAAGAITASSGIIADAAIGTAKIIDGSITSAKIDDLAVTNAKIANGTIQNAKIANLDAAKINTGILNANRIGANSIDTTKLLIQGANLVPNPTFETLTGWTVGGGLNPTLTTTTRGRAAYFRRTVNGERTLTSQEIYVAGQTTYTVGGLVLHQAGSPIPEIRLEVIPVNSSGVDQTPVVVATHGGSSTQWTSIYGQYTVPTSSYRSIRFRFVAGATTTTSGNDYLVQPRIVQAAVGEMIVDGAVKARTMDADEIYADEAHMNVLASGLVATDEVTGLGNSLNITANESIELAVGRQDATDQQLSELREDVDDNTDATEQAATVANDAHIAALAAGADLVAQNSRLEDVESGLSDQQAHFKILPNGVQVAFDDQSASLDMTPQSIRFMSQGTAVAEISQEAIIIHKGIFEQAQIGNHLMQKKGNRTTFTPIEGS